MNQIMLLGAADAEGRGEGPEPRVLGAMVITVVIRIIVIIVIISSFFDR